VPPRQDDSGRAQAHQVHVGDVQAARGHVGRHQRDELAVAEVPQHRLALLLRDVAVQRLPARAPPHQRGELAAL